MLTRNFVMLLNTKKEEVIGKNMKILNSGEQAKEFFENMWKTIASGVLWQNEIKNRRKDGNFFWLNSTIVPYVNHYGVPYQYIIIGVDITITKEIQYTLSKSLEESRITKEKLEVYNQLNHTLTYTLNMEEF